MESTKSIAILMTTYNGEKYIRTQIDSILDQGVDYTLYIRDDHSTDRTVKIIKSYEDFPIVLTEGEENLGVNRSFLELLKFAKTLPDNYEWFAFADQDDEWFQDKLRVALKKVRHADITKPVLYGSASLHTDENLIPTEPNTPRRVKPLTIYNTIIQTIVPGHTYLFNRALLDKIPDDLSEKDFYFYDSFILNTAVMTGKFIYDPTRHTKYRQHKGNVCGNQRNIFKWLKLRIGRVKAGDSKQYAHQIEVLYDLYGDDLASLEKKDLGQFLSSRKSFFCFCGYGIISM